MYGSERGEGASVNNFYPTQHDLVGEYALLAAVYRQAIKDAQRCDKGALAFLSATLPGWQRLLEYAGPVDVATLEHAEQAALADGGQRKRFI